MSAKARKRKQSQQNPKISFELTEEQAEDIKELLAELKEKREASQTTEVVDDIPPPPTEQPVQSVMAPLENSSQEKSIKIWKSVSLVLLVGFSYCCWVYLLDYI